MTKLYWYWYVHPCIKGTKHSWTFQLSCFSSQTVQYQLLRATNCTAEWYFLPTAQMFLQFCWTVTLLLPPTYWLYFLHTFKHNVVDIVGTPTCHSISFPYSALRFTSQLSFLCLHTNPHTDPDNSNLTTTARHSFAPSFSNSVSKTAHFRAPASGTTSNEPCLPALPTSQWQSRLDSRWPE
jgi:hypothetical protein